MQLAVQQEWEKLREMYAKRKKSMTTQVQVRALIPGTSAHSHRIASFLSRLWPRTFGRKVAHIELGEVLCSLVSRRFSNGGPPAILFSAVGLQSIRGTTIWDPPNGED